MQFVCRYCELYVNFVIVNFIEIKNCVPKNVCPVYRPKHWILNPVINLLNIGQWNLVIITMT